MSSFDYYLAYLKSGALELEAYLLSNELFWPVTAVPPGGGQVYPKFTLGGLLHSEKACEAYATSIHEQAELTRITNQIENGRNKWRTAWRAKAHREWISRLRQWGNYLQEYRQQPDMQSSYYSVEVRWRVYANLLIAEIEPPAEELKLQSGLDKILESVFIQGDFIWEAVLEIVYPKEPYWYLYGSPR